MSVITDLQALRDDLVRAKALLTELRTISDRHEEQINGARGQSAAIDGLAAEIKSLRRAAYWVAGIIIIGSITFAFSALSLIGGGP
jgi:hypothetical protein